MLTKDEEFMLAKRWQEHQDSEAAHKMVTSHLRSWPRSPWAIAATACRSGK
jgi:RNA polymerase sigma-32 factor